MLYRVIPNVVYQWQSRLAGPHHPVNSYLLIQQDQVIVIDPAIDLTPEVVASVSAYPVKHVLITHLQSEHAEGHVNFPGATVHVPAGDEYLCQGTEAYRRKITPWPAPWEWETRGNYPGHLAGAANERPLANPVALGSSLREGEECVAGLRVLRTPGHGKNAVTLLADVPGGTIAFCGDLICNGGQMWSWFDCDWDYGFQTGVRTLRASAASLLPLNILQLCPAHCAPVQEARRGLQLLVDRIDAALCPLYDPAEQEDLCVTWPVTATAAPGWFQVLPGLYQWRTSAGNAALLVSQTGNALMVDDGLCHWVDLEQRAQLHQQAISQIKQVTGVQRVEIVIPTHYHGDHTENIPDLVALENTRVVCLDVVADPIEYPERYNLCCPLPWYGTRHDRIRVDQRVPNDYRLKWHEFKVDIFHLGGQTFHHAGIAVTVTGKRVIFVGDSVNNTPECSPVLCYNDAEPTNRGWAYALDRLLEQHSDLLVCGHGMVIAKPKPFLAAARRHWVLRLMHYGQLNARTSMRQFFDPFFSGVPAIGNHF